MRKRAYKTLWLLWNKFSKKAEPNFLHTASTLSLISTIDVLIPLRKKVSEIQTYINGQPYIEVYFYVKSTNPKRISS